MAKLQKKTNQSGRWITWVACGYLLVVVALLFAMHLAGDRFWPATMLLFAPRWMAGLPLLLLLPLALWRKRLALVPLAIAGVLVAWPLMGFTVSFPSKNPGNGKTLRVVTCNTEGGKANRLLDGLIRDTAADIVALQECPRDLPIKAPQGWSVIHRGELAIVSRYPLEELEHVMAFHPPHKWPRYSALLAMVKTPAGDVVFCTVHLPSPRYGLQNVMDRRTIIHLGRTDLLKEETARRSKVARDVSAMVRSHSRPLIVAGDFNMPVESSIFEKNWSTFTDAFSATGFGYGYTERASMRGIKLAVRIDHVLTAGGARPKLCKVGPEVGSDHLPVIADVGF